MSETGTLTGNRALQHEDLLIFEKGVEGRCGVDLEALPTAETRLGAVKPRGRIGLPGLT